MLLGPPPSVCPLGSEILVFWLRFPLVSRYSEAQVPGLVVCTKQLHVKNWLALMRIFVATCEYS